MKKHEDHAIESLGSPPRRQLRWLLIAILIILPTSLFFIGWLCHYAYKQLYCNNRAFELTTIDVVTSCEPLRTIVEECLQKRQIQVASTKLPGIDIRSLHDDLLQDPRTSSVEIRRIFPGTLQISIKPRVPVARLILTPRFLRIDQEGYVLPDDLPGNTDSLPMVTNLSHPELYVLGQKTGDPYVKAFLELIQECALRPDGSTYEVSSVQMETEKEKMILFLKANDVFEANAAVFMPISNVAGNLDRLQTIVEHRRKLNKKISYVDLTFQKNIPVRPE